MMRKNSFKLFIVAIAAASALSVGPAHALLISLGSATSVVGGQSTTLTFLSAPLLELEITTDISTSVTLSAETSISVGNPEGYNGVKFGATAGYSLSVGSGAAITSARLKTPALSASVLASITGSVQARCVRWDAEAEAFSSVDVSINSSNQLVVDMPKPGLYTFATVEASLPYPSLYLEARTTSSAGTKYSYPGGFLLDVATEGENKVTVDFSSETTRAENEGTASMGAFFDINLESGNEADATLQYQYDNSTIDAEAAATLQFAFWDEAEEAWVFTDTGANVDVEASVVTQTTAHFSEWGVFQTAGAGSSGAAAQLALSVLLAAVVAVVALA